MTEGSVRGAVVTVLAVVAGLGIGGCGDDAPPKDEFVDQMMSNSVTPQEGAEQDRWRKVWGCTYDEISSTDVLDRMMELNPGSDIPDDLSAQVSKVLASCMAEVPSTVSTTVPGAPDPSAPATTVLPGAP